jgi:hypothetical protein
VSRPPTTPRRLLVIAGTPVLLLLLWRAWDARPVLAGDAAPVTSGAVALVELFTSEGCSSCPPADALLSEVSRAAEADGRPVLCLAFHVRDWDHLGWRDPFGDARFDDRQRRYARALRADGVYTPQLIVDGTDAFVGSSRADLRRALARALARPAAVALTARVTATEGRREVTWAASPAPAEPWSVLAALVEDGLESRVARGENGGRVLRHDAVVRALARAPGAAAGTLVLEAPTGVDSDHARVVVWAQRERDQAVLGAARAN